MQISLQDYLCPLDLGLQEVDQSLVDGFLAGEMLEIVVTFFSLFQVLPHSLVDHLPFNSLFGC